MEHSVTLEEMLAARDARQKRIQDALQKAPLISFTMNIPGPKKNSPLIRRGFAQGLSKLWEVFGRESLNLNILFETDAVTGCEALIAADGDALTLKRLCAAIEDADELGRLFDMDVIAADGKKLDRADLGLSQRDCMVCGAAGRGCAARRTHTVEELQQETHRRLFDFLKSQFLDSVSAIATRSLLGEVRTTPKPGLVDRANSGSHRDMDLPLFEKSAAALAPFWRQCAALGIETAALAPEETFRRLRPEGMAAEETMLAATGGVNTHKGAIFLMGVLCGALGRLFDPIAPCRSFHRIAEECSAMTAPVLRNERGRLRDENSPDALPLEQLLCGYEINLDGARGEISRGLPGVCDGLSKFKELIAAGCTGEHAASVALLHLIARGTDTNMVKRGGMTGAIWGAQAARELVCGGRIPGIAEIRELDRQFIEKNLSPGGCADLLALILFAYEWENIAD